MKKLILVIACMAGMTFPVQAQEVSKTTKEYNLEFSIPDLLSHAQIRESLKSIQNTTPAQTQETLKTTHRVTMIFSSSELLLNCAAEGDAGKDGLFRSSAASGNIIQIKRGTGYIILERWGDIFKLKVSGCPGIWYTHTGYLEQDHQ